MTELRRPRPLVGAAVAALAVATLAGCAAQKPTLVDFSEKERNYVDKDYVDVYARWTRHERAFLKVTGLPPAPAPPGDLEVDVALEAWATFKSWEFREAYIERYVSVYGLSEADRETLRRSQLEAFHKAYEFHLTAESASSKWNDLEKQSSAWRTTLVDAVGHELTPEPIKVEKLPDAYEREFFPDRTPFTKTYSIRFVVPSGDTSFGGPQSGRITLRIASPIGRLDLTWQSI
jgi:hypothetical protein